MAEGAPLLRVYTLIAYRGFESLALRHKTSPYQGAFFMAEIEVKQNPPVRQIAYAIWTTAGAAQRSKRGRQPRFESIPPRFARYPMKALGYDGRHIK